MCKYFLFLQVYCLGLDPFILDRLNPKVPIHYRSYMYVPTFPQCGYKKLRYTYLHDLGMYSYVYIR